MNREQYHMSLRPGGRSPKCRLRTLHFALCTFMLLVVTSMAATPAWAQFNVVSVTPELHSTRALLNENVTVMFSTNVDVATLNANTFRVYGSQTGQISGVYSVDETGMVGIFQPALPYKPGEFISVVLTDQVQAVGGGALLGGYHWEFSARPQYGAGAFAVPTGSTSPTASVLYPTNTLRNPTSIYAGDLTGDAYPELAIANSSSPNVTIMLNSRGGTINVDNLYIQELVVGLQDNPLDITGGDINGDGQLDLVVTHYTVSSLTILQNQTNGGSLPSMQTQVVQTTERPFSATVADLNGDGWQDIAVAGFGSDEVAVHLNDGNGVFSSFTGYSVGQAASDIVARDMTNDGFVDLIVTSTGDQRVDILTNNGAGVFTLSQSIPLGYTPASISAFDFQEATNGVFGDTWADIFVTAQDTALVTVLEHLGDPAALTFVREDVAIPLLSQAFGHVLADVDVMDDGGLGPDADLDAIITQFSTNEIRLLLNQAAGPFVEGQQFGGNNVGDTPLGIAAGDFERDGDVDVAFVSATSNQVRVLFNDDARLSDFELIGDLPDFGDVYTCEDSTLVLSFLNRRFETVSVLDIVADPSPPFIVNLPTLPFDVAARDTFSVEVTFDPDLPIPYTGLFVITSNDGFETSTTEVPLVGQGIETDLSAVPDTVDFGQVVIFELAGRGVEITNNGNVAAVIDSLEVSDPINFSADFSGLTTTTIDEGGASDVLNTVFMPQALGPFAATVTMYVNDPCDSTLTVTLIGEGIEPIPDLIADSLWADVTTIVAGQTVQLTGQLDAGVVPPEVATLVQFDNDEGDAPIQQQVEAGVTGISQYTAAMQLDTPGLRTITFTVDADDSVAEVDELNNTFSIQINVTPAPQPDLIAEDLILSPSDVEVGDDVTFEGVLGIGNVDMAVPTAVRFELDGVLYELDTALPTIGVGQQRSFITAPFTPDQTGTYTVTFIVDADDEIIEGDETNNEISVEFEVSRGELVITPNPFTPNNDGINEEVQIDFARLVLEDPKLLIYSFEGRLIREIDEPEGTRMLWDGRDSNDRNRDPGVYLFVLMEGDEVVDSGHITLAR